MQPTALKKEKRTSDYVVLDDGKSTISLIINKSASESLIGMKQDQISSQIVENGTMAFVQELRDLLLGKKLKASGRTIVDDQGAMLLSDDVELIEVDSVLAAAELRAKWGGLMQPARRARRQPAWHMLASEFSDSTLSQQGSGEFDPLFVITKLGAKVNRVVVAGMLERLDPRETSNGSTLWQGQLRTLPVCISFQLEITHQSL